MEEDIIDVLEDFDIDFLKHDLVKNRSNENNVDFKKYKRKVHRLQRHSIPNEKEEIIKLSKIDHNLEKELIIDIEEDEDVFKRGERLSLSSSKILLTTESFPNQTDEVQTQFKINQDNGFSQESAPIVDKKNFQVKLSSAIGYGNGGITLMHDNNGVVIQVVVHNDSNGKLLNHKKRYKRKSRNVLAHDHYYKCFESENAPFRLLFSLKTLLIAEMHSYTSYKSVSIGLFQGWFDKEDRILHVTSSTPIAPDGLTICNWNLECGVSFTEQMVVGWYFSHPMVAADSATDIQPIHSDLQTLFTKNSIGPFFTMILSPYSRTKARCITTVDGCSYFIDYKVEFKGDTSIADIEKNMKEAVARGNRIQFNEICAELNFKTYGQLCYESIRRLLDSTINNIPFELKEELISATKHLVDFNQPLN